MLHQTCSQKREGLLQVLAITGLEWHVKGHDAKHLQSTKNDEVLLALLFATHLPQVPKGFPLREIHDLKKVRSFENYTC